MLQGLIIVNTLLYLSIRVVVRWKLAWPGGGPLPGCDQTTQRLGADRLAKSHYPESFPSTNRFGFSHCSALVLQAEKSKQTSFLDKVHKGDILLFLDL